MRWAEPEDVFPIEERFLFGTVSNREGNYPVVQWTTSCLRAPLEEVATFLEGPPMRRLFAIFLSLSLLSLVGCGGGNSSGTGPAVLQSISVAPSMPTVIAGTTQSFTATGHYSDSTTRDLTSSATWTSSVTATATISSMGVVTAKAHGTTTVSAASGGVSGSTTVTVPPFLVSLVVSTTTPSIAATTTASFTATGTYDDGTTQDITSSVSWTSSATDKATISDTAPTKGLAKGVAAGSSTITAKTTIPTGMVSNTAMLNVTNATVVSIAVTPSNPTISLGIAQQFKATGTFSDATTQDITNTVTWGSSASAIASITVSGLATGVNFGSTNITAASGGVTGSTSLTVNLANVQSLSITPGDVSIAPLTTQQFQAVGKFTDGSTKNLNGLVVWTSSNTAAATIGSNNGLAKGLASGASTITATLATSSTTSLTKTVTLTVTNATVTGMTVTPVSRSIPPGSKLQMTATAEFSDTTTQVVTSTATWASDATSVATVNGAGIATGIGAGSANISASLGGVTGSAPLTVTGATLTSLAITPTTAVLAPASTLKYQAIGTYSDTTNQNLSTVVTWGTTDGNVVAMSSAGLATGESAGTAQVTAKIPGAVCPSASCATANVLVESTALQSITVTPGTATIPALVGEQYTATANFADGSTQDITSSVTWTSSTPAVATISNSTGIAGQGVGVSPGNTTITATFGGKAGSAVLTVNNAALQSVTVTPANPNIALGTSQQFTANGNFSDATTFNVTDQVSWSSTNVNIAVISGGGLANSAAVGTTTIKAALGPAPTVGTTVLTVH